MGEIKDQVDALTAQVTEYNQDVTAKVKALSDAIGDNPPGPIRDALVALKDAVSAGVSFVGDADQDGNPEPPIF